MTRVLVLFAGLLTCIIAPQLLYAVDDDYDRQEMQKRIAPLGQVRVELPAGTAVEAVDAAVPKEEVKAPGQEIYERHCIACHADGLANAPKFRNKADWAPRMQAAKLDELVAIAIQGLNVMPPKGTCSECTEDEIKQAIQYMLPKE